MSEKITAQSLAERLEPTHLSEVKAQVDEADKKLNAKEEEANVGPNPRDAEEYPFSIHYVDARKKVWKGDFVNKILTIRERRLTGPLQAKLLLGEDLASLPKSAVELAAIQAHLTYSLKEAPAWLDDVDNLNDPQILYAIYEEVASHEAYFHRGAEDQSPSKESEG